MTHIQLECARMCMDGSTDTFKWDNESCAICSLMLDIISESNNIR